MPDFPTNILPKNPDAYTPADVVRLIDNVTDLALYLAGGIAVIFLIIGAYQYFTAFGNEERANKGKTTITWAIIGVVVILLGRVLVGEILRLVRP